MLHWHRGNWPEDFADANDALAIDPQQPVAWVMTMLGYDGYSMRVWFEPIEDEL